MKIRKRLHFTLVELMVTMSVFMFFIIILTAFFSNANRLWVMTEKNTEVVTQSQIILDTLDRLFAGTQVNAETTPMIFETTDIEDLSNTGATVTPKPYTQDNEFSEQFKEGSIAIFATVSDMEIGRNAVSNYYLVSIIHTADDKLKVRTISGPYLKNNMKTLLTNTRKKLIDLFRKKETAWNNDGCLTLELSENVTRFVIYPAVLEKGKGLQFMPPTDPGDSQSVWGKIDDKSVYAVKVEISLLSNDDYKVWRQLWPERTKGIDKKYAEPDAAKNFRSLHEKTFSRIIYIGPKKEVQAP